MAYVQFVAFINDLSTLDFWYTLKNKHSTNLSHIVLNGQFWAHIKILIAFTCHQNQHLLGILLDTSGFLDKISDNMESLVQSGKYGAINTSDTTTNGFFCYSIRIRGIYATKKINN